MREYELMYIINPRIGGDEEYTAFIDRINTLITSSGGTLVVVGGEPSAIVGRRKLAYPIHADGQDLTEGYYVVTRFEAAPTQISVIERDLKLAEPIIRYLLIRPEIEKPVVEDED
jgi:small subunit ribosomal protein S6